MASFVRLDLFPASVVVDGTRYEPCRAIVTDDSVNVYMDSAGGPALVYTKRIDDFSGRRTIGYTVLGADGEQIAVDRASGCGCGSRLRGFHPFAGVPQIQSQ